MGRTAAYLNWRGRRFSAVLHMRTTTARFLFRSREGQHHQRTFDIAYETLDGLAFHLNAAAASIGPNLSVKEVLVCLPEPKELDEETYELYMDQEKPLDLQVRLRSSGFAWKLFPASARGEQ